MQVSDLLLQGQKPDAGAHGSTPKEMLNAGAMHVEQPGHRGLALVSLESPLSERNGELGLAPMTLHVLLKRSPLLIACISS